jgi:hypothetical protein
MSGSGRGTPATRPAPLTPTPSTDPFANALTAIFNTLGTDVTIGSSIVKGNFRNQYISVNGIESLMPTVECIDSDVATVAHGTTLTIASLAYKIIGIQPDGQGCTTLILSRD